MKKLTVLIALALLTIAGTGYAGEKPKPAPHQDSVALAEARARYIRVVTVRRQTGEITGAGTALRINRDYAITSFHMLTSDIVAMETLGDGKLAPMDIRAISTDPDILYFRTAESADLPPAKFAEDIWQDEDVLSYSNADGRNGFVSHYRVAKVDKNNGVILLDTMAMLGESGAGLFNSKGEVVSQVDGNMQSGVGNKGYGRGPNSTVLKAFLEFAVSHDCGKPIIWNR